MTGGGRPPFRLALAAGLLVALGGLGAMALIAPTSPDAGFRARVQVWREMPSPTRPPAR